MTAARHEPGTALTNPEIRVLAQLATGHTTDTIAARGPRPATTPARLVSTAEEDWEPFCTCHRSAPCHYCCETRTEED